MLLMLKTLIIRLYIIIQFLTLLVMGQKKPNIMIIFADDIGTGDVPGYWNKAGRVRMPNLYKFTTEGTTFTDFHSTPICAPSRYVLLSGNYQHRGVRHTGVWNVNYKTNQFWDGQQSIAQVLRDNGYNTGVFGKWHLGAKVQSPFDPQPGEIFSIADNNVMISDKNHEWRKPLEKGPDDLGFTTSYVSMAGAQRPPYVFFRNGMIDLYGWNPKNLRDDIQDHIKYWKPKKYDTPQGITRIKGRGGEGAKNWDSAAYNQIIVEETEKFLDQHIVNNVTDQPFFAYVPLGAAHQPFSPPDFYLDGTPVAGVYPDRHLDTLGLLDKLVGSFITMLDDRQLLKDTIVIFTSDNGGSSQSTYSGHNSSGNLRAQKGSIYEGGHRVPLTIRWDNGDIPQFKKRSHVLGMNDLFATICDLVGIEVPENQAIDSVSFADYIFDDSKTENLRNSLGTWTFDGTLSMSSLRKGKFKMIHNYETNELQLYNLKKDIGEKKNLVKRRKVFLRRARKMLRELKQFGPCYDSAELFKVGDELQDCQWFMANYTRCYFHLEGIYNCRKTCAQLFDRNSCGKVDNSYYYYYNSKDKNATIGQGPYFDHIFH